MAMPIRLIYNVRISLKQKIGLVCVFGLCFVMISFTIIRAKQVLVQQQFVNLTLLMIWSTLTAAICQCRPPSSPLMILTTPAVIVGSLPALKVLVTNRHDNTKPSMYGSHGSKRKPQFNEYNNPRANVALSSLSSEKKSIKGRGVDSSDSQEEILQPEHNQFVVVKHDFVSALDPLRCFDWQLMLFSDGVIRQGRPATPHLSFSPASVWYRQGYLTAHQVLLCRSILFATSTLFFFLGQQPSMASMYQHRGGGGGRWDRKVGGTR